MAFKQRTYTEVPHDENMSPQTREFLASLLSQVNALSGTGAPTAGAGINALSQNQVRTGQIVSAGSWAPSITTPVAFTTTTTSATFFWDGSHGSASLKIYRDTGVVSGPFIQGSGFTVSGLTANTKYFFFMYWDDTLQKVAFASIPGVSVGSPPVAFLAQNVQALAQQVQTGHIALGQTLASTGLTTPASGTGSGSGGGGGGGGSGCPLSGAPVRLYGDPGWWTKTVEPAENFVRIVSTNKLGFFTPHHRLYCQRGLVEVRLLVPGDLVLTDDGEEDVIHAKLTRIPGASADRYEATQGHIYSAWGFIGHNVKPF